MQTIVKAADDAALLALMPHLIGMQPRNSVVLLGFLGNRTFGGLRVDLPAPAGASPALVYKRVSKALVGMLGKLHGADGVVVVVVTDELFGQAGVPPHLEFVAELTRCIERSRFALKAALCRASDGWAPYFDPDVPAGGYPLTDIVDAGVISQLPPDQPELFDAAATPSRVPDADENVKLRVMAQFRRSSDELYGDAPVDSSTAELLDARSAIELAEQVLDLDGDEFARGAGAYLAGAQSSIMRDVMMLQWASDAATGSRLWSEVGDLDRTGSWEGSELLDLLRGRGPRPDFERVDRAISFVLKVTACAEDSARPGPLCVLAWLHWAMGRGSVAAVYLAEAAQIDPENPRVVALDERMRNGVMPPWLFEDNDEDARREDARREDARWEDDDWDEDQEDDDEDDWDDGLPGRPF